MIERLLAAFADGAGDNGPNPGAGAEEIADILWLAARIDGGGPPPAAPAGGTRREQPPFGQPSLSGTGPESGGPAPGEPAVRLYPAVARADRGKPAGSGGGRRGSPLRLPRTASLDDPLALMRSLRPVGRRSIGGPGEELDEQLTVERSIERMVPSPVLRPAESRWLDLALIVDTHHSMLLWADLVDELRRVLTRSGVFRDVRTWHLTGTGSGATPMVARVRGGPPRNPLELSDPAGRRLILVLSDTVAAGWRQAPLQGVLRHWSAHNAVAVLNVLPERLWTRGAVQPVPFAVRADRPAAATRSWQRVPAVRRARAGRRGGGAAAVPVVPVVGLASGSLGRLVRVVSGDGRWRRVACLRLDAPPGTTGAQPPPGDPPTGLEAVENFRASASPTAQRLAAHLAAVPLTLPVMTLVRRSLLREAQHGHLAEVALGGLFAPWGDEQDAAEVEFEFLPGVREALLGAQLRGDVAAVRELVRRRVWEFMSRNRGTGPDFSATRVTTGREGRRGVAEGALPFAAQPPQPPQPPQLPQATLPGAGPREQPPGPAPEAGLGERLVRVRFEPLRGEAQEVGTLLTPRLVLTVGDARLGPGAVGWVRAGDREALCHAVWCDEGSPRVFLLLADRDLLAADRDPADTGTWPGPPPWEAPPDRSAGDGGPGGRVRVDGSTDQGDPVALTGEAALPDGARNGELVRLSAEPESWTHYRGGPVSRAGRLLGVVHGVWPDRMVYLSGHALLEDPDFRAVLDAHSRAPAPFGEPGTPLHLAVSVDVEGDTAGRAAGPPVAAALREVLRRTGTSGQVIETSATDLLVVVDAPGALGTAGRVLGELPSMVREVDEAHRSWRTLLAVAVSGGEAGFEEAGFSGTAVAAAARRMRGSRPPGYGPFLAVSPPLHEKLDRLLGPTVPPRLPGSGDGPEGWLWTGDCAELGQAMTEADEIRGSGGAHWPVCGFRTPDGDGPDGGRPGDGGPGGDRPDGGRRACAGIRLPGGRGCLAHAAAPVRESYLRGLRPGAPVDLRGTTFEGGLLRRVLDALRDPGTGRVTPGPCSFDHAHFEDDWSTAGARFAGSVSFARAVFAGGARFGDAVFDGPAVFDGAVFRAGATFDRSRFARRAAFRRTVFGGPAGFADAAFLDEASFARAVLEASADLNGLRVAGRADFFRTVFRGPAGLGGAVFTGPAVFSYAVWERGLASAGTVFGQPAAFDHAVFRGRVRLDGVRFPPGTDAARDVTALPGTWTSARHPDGTWDLHLTEAVTEAVTEAETDVETDADAEAETPEPERE
ncbi:SAV_2336 N-terminal domain-related protein [Streptomyces sp. NPDC058613]|uniref:SAV_2336 N-terminal domain-related protein n=1 Tax=Streptomyces sp. NPDC058613 TaxID=3346556 RepID=UPI00365EA31D